MKMKAACNSNLRLSVIFNQLEALDIIHSVFLLEKSQWRYQGLQ